MADEVIILNKVFEGGWITKQGHISHGVIDFIPTDSGERYIYNVPHGSCPKWIFVGKKIGQETHEAKFLLITGNSQVKNGFSLFQVFYCIELEERLHYHSKPRNNNKGNANTDINSIRKYILNICNAKGIKYCGKTLDKIYGNNDQSLLITFKAKGIYQAKKPIDVRLNLNYKHTVRYVRKDKEKCAFKELQKVISDKNNWKELYSSERL